MRVADEVGDVVLSKWLDPVTGQWQLAVVKADPISRISCKLAYEIMASDNDDYRIDVPGNVLTINAHNRRVVYVIDRDSYDERTDSFLMRWPD